MVRGVVDYYLQFILRGVLPDGFLPKKEAKSQHDTHTLQNLQMRF